MTPTLQDVAILVNLLIYEAHVTGLATFNKDELCFYLLRRVPPKGYRRDYIRFTWLNKSFETPPEGAIKIVLHYYAKACIMHMFGAMIFTGLTSNAVSCYFLPLLKKFVVIHNYN